MMVYASGYGMDTSANVSQDLSVTIVKQTYVHQNLVSTALASNYLMDTSANVCLDILEPTAKQIFVDLIRV